MKDALLAQTQLLLPADALKLFNDTWFAMPNWKWLGLGAVLFLGLLFVPALQIVLEKFFRTLRGREEAHHFGQYLLESPVQKAGAWVFICLMWLAAIDNIGLPAKMDKYLTLLVQITLVLNLIRLLYLGVDAGGRLLTRMAARTETPLDDQLIPLATKTLKILVVVLSVLIALQNFGVNVASILAGLGLGGLALALAAKDTAANLFGSVTILLDNPFKVGDWIKVGDTEGNVEEIGFRSTRIRTFYNSLITVPNSVIANERIDNMGARRRRRVRQTLGLLYETPPEKIAEFCDSVRYLLQEHPQVAREAVSVTFKNFSAASLDIQVTFHIVDVLDSNEEEAVTQTLFLEILEAARKAGVEFAYPTQTLYVKNNEGSLSSAT
ncbi:MAG: mechanosensitive ion channel family protein [Bdellovibrionaceae bacterium]|nr:mechanosensitive ion channel family protein [Pseudobdellovibrionaceae bacterium]